MAARSEQRISQRISWRNLWRMHLWSRGLPAGATIEAQTVWPLILLPFALFGQLVTPHPVWVALLTSIVGVYAIGYAWVRKQVQGVRFMRRRTGAILVAGDSLQEEFVVHNESGLPLLWAAFVDASDLPGYAPGVVVACGAHAEYRWKSEAVCERRGVFRLGPHSIEMGDPFGLFRAVQRYDSFDQLLIYPRVVQLPEVALPRGGADGHTQRRRSLAGARPAASVRDYAPGDSLRLVHWPTTAHRGRLTTKELELEPSGDVWIVLDLDAATQAGQGVESTLEYGIVLAASMAAEMVSGRERRAVGLLAASGDRVITLAPQPGQAQLWAIMAALAPAQPSATPLHALLQRSLPLLGRRHTLVVVTPSLGERAPLWIAELVRAGRQGLFSSVLAVATPEQSAQVDECLALLARLDIPHQFLRTDLRLRAALTYRRRRKVIRTTPTGGAFTVEVEEEVG
ncbi:MAG: DUF58 domain-containing protein [Caldilinea sp.]|nr:DUF58 domain-containing protein [Caldilinea sp.]MDW8440365.1 DUF58 domain-containing protein [Caldilineaceae bacterium]